MKISLITGSVDPHYQLDLLAGLVSAGLEVDFIGGDSMKHADIIQNKNVNFHNFRGSQDTKAPINEKIARVLKYYGMLIEYAYKTDSGLFHIQWENKFIHFDRTVLNLYYKILRKRLVFTAHNVNAGERDDNNSLLNRMTLRFKYRIADHIIVHTEKMKQQLVSDFNIRENKVTVIPHGINNVIPQTGLTRVQAREKLRLNGSEKVLLFFGNIAPYKGLKHLVLALVELKRNMNDIKLIITGRFNGQEAYWEEIQNIIREYDLKEQIIEKTGFVPDQEVEIYYKAADVLILPYNYIFQSGVIFVSYAFGLPVIATDVGSLKEEIVEGKTGVVCQPQNPADLADKIYLYFQSDLYKSLESNRKIIMDYANEKYSWEKIGEKTFRVYKNVLGIVALGRHPIQ